MSTKYNEANRYVLANKTLMRLVNDFPAHVAKSNVDKWNIGFQAGEHCNPHTQVFKAFGLGFIAYSGTYGSSNVSQYGNSLPGGLAEDLFLEALNANMDTILKSMAEDAAKRAHHCHEELCDEMQKYTDLLNKIREALGEMEYNNDNA